MKYSRRQYIVLGGTVVTGALAGCSGSGDGGDGTDDGSESTDDGTDDGSESTDDGTDDGSESTDDGSQESDDGSTDGDDGSSGDGEEMEDGESEEEAASPPASDTDPRELLPEPPDGWEQTEIVEQTEDSLNSIGAEAGIGAFYTDPDDGEYFVEISRWPSESDAQAGWDEVYSEGPSWVVYVPTGNFSFAANGPDSDDVESSIVTLLSNSPPLTEEYIEQNDLAVDRP